mmetsp:Transcript_27345/g.79252  ORF Transcript_27345/g.79252 Transcript_27345/m.79252 type:complete len:244 (-) Transcript_27345:1110-1841(-)
MDEVGGEAHPLLALVHRLDVDVGDRHLLLLREHGDEALLLVRLDAREADGRHPTRRPLQLVQHRRDRVEPTLDQHRPLENLVDGLQHQAGQVPRQHLKLPVIDLVPDHVLQLPQHLLPRADRRHAVADGHDRLLHDLPLQDTELDEALGVLLPHRRRRTPRLILPRLRGRLWLLHWLLVVVRKVILAARLLAKLCRGVLLHLFLDDLENDGVHVLWAVAGREVHRCASGMVAAEGRIMLQAVA